MLQNITGVDSIDLLREFAFYFIPKFFNRKRKSFKKKRPQRSLINDKGIRVVSARTVSALGRFGLGHFGQFLGWVVSAFVGGSFRPIFWVSRFGPESFRPKYMEIHQNQNQNSLLVKRQTDNITPGDQPSDK